MRYKKLIVVFFIFISLINVCQAETLTLRPDGAGKDTDLTPIPAVANYLNVDEAVPDDDTTYVYTSYDLGENDIYSLGNSTYQRGPINSVTVYAVAKETGSGTIRLVVYTNSVRYYGDIEGLFGSYDEDDHIWTTNPSTGNPWTWDEINNLEAGVNINSNTAIVNITQVYVVVNYDLATPAVENPVNESTETSTSVFLNVSTTDDLTLSYYFYGGTATDSMVFLGNNDSVGGSSFNWSLSQYDVYYWTARSYDGDEYSSNMTTAQFTVVAPPNLTSPVNSSTQYVTYPPLISTISFSWQDLAAPQYRLLIGEDVNFNIVTIDIHVGTNNTNQDLLVDKEYWWKVYSYDGATYSDSSGVYSFNLTGNSTLSGSAIEGVIYASVNSVNTALSGAEVTIWNETWTDTAITGSNGYYLFTGVFDGKVYNLQAKKDLYLDSSIALVNATSDPITQDFFLLPDRTSEEWRHYVKFIVWGPAGYYEGVTITVYENSDVTALYTAVTGNDGAVTFIMDRQQEYRVTAIDATQGIDRSMTIYPKDEKYLFFIASTDSWTEHEELQSDIINIEVSTEEINSTHTYINVSYTDSMSETTSWTLYLNQSNISTPHTQNTLQSTSDTTSTWTHSFIVDEYKGESYWLNIKGVHSTYGVIDEQYSVMFEEEIGFSGIPQKAWLYIAILIMMFTGGMFGASSASQGSMIVCIEGWIFWAFGWFSTIDNGGIIAVGLGAATVISILSNINQYSKKEGHE